MKKWKQQKKWIKMKKLKKWTDEKNEKMKKMKKWTNEKNEKNGKNEKMKKWKRMKKMKNEKKTVPMSQTATTRNFLFSRQPHSGDQVKVCWDDKKQFNLRSCALCSLTAQTQTSTKRAGREGSHRSGRWEVIQKCVFTLQVYLQIPFLRIHDTFHKIQPLWGQPVTVTHDENATHIQLDVF